ncbi:hypothetical protein NEOLEDRAFT_1042275, partial [Neolentinus lepideus HHB14362 ss-1]
FSNLQILEPIISVWLIGTALTDSVITLTLVLHLVSVSSANFEQTRNHRSGFAATDNVISRLIRLTVPTGMITTVVAILDLVIVLLYFRSFCNSHFIFNLPLAKLYTNCCMSSLNARIFWRLYDSTPEES